MRHYRLYTFFNGRIVEGEDVLAPDDRSAVELAQRKKSRPLELWCSARKVARLE